VRLPVLCYTLEREQAGPCLHVVAAAAADRAHDALARRGRLRVVLQHALQHMLTAAPAHRCPCLCSRPPQHCTNADKAGTQLGARLGRGGQPRTGCGLQSQVALYASYTSALAGAVTARIAPSRAGVR